jgi:hypothetical protein
MSNDDKIRTGLWKNEEGKPAGYSGNVEIGGQEYFVNLYKNERKETDRHPDLNLVLKPKTGGRSATPAKAAASFADDDPDSIPF